jgi:hypothetical protein
MRFLGSLLGITLCNTETNDQKKKKRDLLKAENTAEVVKKQHVNRMQDSRLTKLAYL